MKFRLNPVATGFAIAFAVAVSASSPAVAASLGADEIRYAKAALQAAEGGDYNRGQAMATRDPALVKLIRWMELRRPGRASFAEIVQFMAANPDWPGKHALRLRAEEVMPVDMPDADVVAWFQKNPPLGAGRLRLADAYLRTGQRAKAEELIREAWVAGDFDANQEKTFLLRYRDSIRPQDHWARLDRMLWDGRTGSPYQRMLTRVDPGQKTLAETRMRLKSGAGGIERAVNAVPASLQNDSGFLYERAKWRRVRGQNDGARDILIKPPPRLVRPELWWREVEYQARQALRDGDISLAYKLAASHKPGDGKIQADAEFFAGFVALRFLEDPETALGHFRRLHEGVTSPISKARGAYWAGRAAEATKDAAGAKAWYGKAAEHLTTFYGQIAAGKLSDTAPALPQDAKPTPAEVQTFRRHELTRIVALLDELGPNEHFVAFSIALVECAKTPGERTLALKHIRSLGRTDTAVAVARRVASREGHVLIEDAYPTINLPKGEGPEAALVHAVIRQESGFDQRAVSRAKAQGLMQLMPATAKIVSKELGLKYDLGELTQNPSYNITLGSSYLHGLIGDFDGSYIAAIAGYNAGPGRIKRWLRDNGDVRKGDVDVLDWIEQIPIAETRNYVQRVLEALFVYRSRMPKAPTTDMAQALNRWCLYGCGGVIEANVAKARIGRAGADDACDVETDRNCGGDEDVIARDRAPAVEPVAAPAAETPVVVRPSAARSGAPRTGGKD